MTLTATLATYAALVVAAIGACYADFRWFRADGKLAMFAVIAIIATVWMFFQGPVQFAAAFVGACTMWVSFRAILNKY